MNKFLILFIGVVVILWSCNSENDLSAFSIGDEFVRSETSIAIVDTYSVRMSTVIVDSIATSQKGVLFAGQYHDEYFGKVSSNAYMEFTLPENLTPEENDKLDSLTLKMKYSGLVYGDTLKSQTFSVYRLEEPLESHDDGQLYNTSSFKYNEVSIGTYTFVPKPGKDGYLEIRLPDELGQEFLDKKLENADELTGELDFREYFYGLVLKGSTGDGAILSFNAQDTTIGLVLYTHRVELERSEIEYRFGLYTSGIYFNEINEDRTNTAIDLLKENDEDLPSGITDNKSFMQAGMGIYTRLEFPSLTTLLEKDRKFVLAKAELILKPVRGSYNEIPPAPEIVLYDTDEYNRVIAEIQNKEGGVIPASLYVDDVYKQDTYYEFDVTSYVTAELADADFDVDHGLLVGLTGSKMGASLDRVVFDGSVNNSFRSMLKLYYIFYN